jgi:membrane-bound lytic murein transglycosylase D
MFSCSSRMLAGVLATWVALFVVAHAPAAFAQEPDEGDVGEEPGPTESPPGPEGDEAPTVSPDDELRKGVRGSPVPVTPESPSQKAQREWEEKTFPKPSATPPEASDESEKGREPYSSTPTDKADLPPELRSPAAATKAPGGTAAKPRAPKRPEDVRPDLPWLKGLRLGDLPITWDARVIKYLEYYKDDPRGRQLMSEWIREQGRFRPLILAALRKHGLPEDLLYVCMSESAFNPWDYSRTGASGLWQFMPAGGKVYGLHQDYWIDERNDPEKATEAAMLHWRDLHDRFGNWDLAMAAYNAGHGAVLKAIAKFNSNDFWSLVEYENGLPWASQIYVAKAQALSIVGRNRELFGYDKIVEAPMWDFERVSVDRSVALSVIAKAVGATEADLRWLNPELRRGRTPAGVKSYSVRIPKGKKEQFARTFPTLRGDWDGFDAYVMRHGERFEDVARTYGVPLKKLRELNGVDEIAEVRGGTIIVVPKVDEATRTKNRAEAELDLYQSDVAPGDPGDPMIVAVPDKDRAIAGRRRVFYRVVAGDTAEEIAAALGVPVTDLRAWNAITEEAELQPRMVLVAYVKADFDADARHVALLDDSRLMVVTAGSEEHLDLVEGRKGRKRVRIVCKAGDTMESLGKPHHLTKYDMARINKRSYQTELPPGTELIVYEVVDKAKARKAGVFDKKKSSTPKARQGRGKPRGK